MSSGLNRRRFLAAAVAVGTAAGAMRCAAGQLKGKVKKAVKYHMITEDLSVMDKFKLLKDLGFEGVEPRTQDAREQLAAMVKASDATGIQVHGVVNSSSPAIRDAIDVARQVGGTSVLLVVPADAEGSYLKNYSERQQLIRDALPHAEKHSIKLLIENVWASFLNEPLSMARFVDELESPMLGVYFDVGNNIRWGHAEQWIEVLGRRIGKLDIKEYDQYLHNSQGLRAGFNVEIGDGSVHWQRVREELIKIDYAGWATAEVKGGDRARLAEIAARMDQVLGL